MSGIDLPDGLVQDNRILPVLTRLMGCVEQEIEAAGIATCFSGIVTGSMADATHVADEPMVWLRMGEVTPVVAEGRPNVMSCGVELEVTVEIGFLTCYPADPEGDPLTVDQNLAITMIVNAAMMALHRAINCCPSWLAAPGRNKVMYDVTGWTPAGPQGLVVGGAWSLRIVV